MAKKLLMNSGGLMPVQDGLICWLDGRDGKNGDTVWKDRSGNGNDFELVGNFIFENGIIKFRGGYSYISKDLEGSMIQLHFKYYRTYNGWSYLMDSLRTPNNNSYIASSIGSYIDHFGDGFLTDKFYNNGVFLERKPYITANTENTLCVIKRNPIFNKIYLASRDLANEFMDTDIYSVLIYNRILTDEEIKQNYEYEKSIQRG